MIVDVTCDCPDQLEITYNVVQHCYNELIPSADVDIFIEIKKQKLNGWCQHNCANEFVLSIDRNLSQDELIKTICHEMVHVKQGVRNELSASNKFCRIWKGSKYNISYRHSPWEIEAYYLEEKLFNSFMEKYAVKKDKQYAELFKLMFNNSISFPDLYLKEKTLRETIEKKYNALVDMINSQSKD